MSGTGHTTGKASAFPHLDESCQRVNETEHTPGLTKRELFAALALQGICAYPDKERGMSYEDMAGFAVEAADALLEALTDEPHLTTEAK
jgi:hypothetical protein